MTPAKARLVAASEKMRIKRAQKMRHPEKNLRTMNSAVAAMNKTRMDYDRVFEEEKDYDELDKIYHTVNKQPAATQLGIVELAQENFLKSKGRFSRQLLVGS